MLTRHVYMLDVKPLMAQWVEAPGTGKALFMFQIA